MAQELKQGDTVEWNTPQGKTRGTVKKKRGRPQAGFARQGLGGTVVVRAGCRGASGAASYACRYARPCHWTSTWPGPSR